MTLTEGVFVTDVKVTDIDDVIVYGDKVTKFHNNTKIFFTKYC